MDDDSDHQIICATYTHARRHPMVLGNIGGWTPPFQLTLVQVGVLIGAYVIEMQTWRWWGAKLPMTLAAIIAIGVPCLLAWVVRRTRMSMGRRASSTARAVSPGVAVRMIRIGGLGRRRSRGR